MRLHGEPAPVPSGRPAGNSSFFVAIACTSLATLLLELSLTRIFSVVLFYHYAFLVISIALFGLGVGGVFSYLVAEWPGTTFQKMGILSAANAIVVVLSLVAGLQPGDIGSMTFLASIYFTSAMPFCLSGAILSMAISEAKGCVDRAYLFDLMGAAAACLLLVPLVNRLGGPNTTLAAGLLFAVSGALWFHLANRPKARRASCALAAGFCVLVGVNLSRPVLDVTAAKGRILSNERFSKWNSFSRIGLDAEEASGAPNIVIDGDASTLIGLNEDFASLTESQRLERLQNGAGLPYRLRPAAKTLIIGPGGGPDVVRALTSGSRDVTGVEINPIIVNEIMRGRFSALSRGLYFRPDVHIFVEEGRGFVRRSRDRYQVIQATLVDTWASTAAGAFALAENNLYTSEAFAEYLTHLTEDGILAFSRWGFDPPRESLRLVSLARFALETLGEKEVWRHFAVVREPSPYNPHGLDTILIARKPLRQGDLEILKDAARPGGLTVLYMPGQPVLSAFSSYLRANDVRSFESTYPYDVSVVDDDRPFFFFTVPTRDLAQLLRPAQSEERTTNTSVNLLLSLIGTTLLATLMILVLPPVVLGPRLPFNLRAAGLLPYFVCIGVGYIVVEVALIQKFVLFLGHPTYALTVVIFLMLLSSGAGSYASRALAGGSQTRWLTVLASVPLAAAVVGAAANYLLPGGIGLTLPWKIAAAAALIAPLGFVMGMPFPLGLTRLECHHAPSVRWAWALNAAASVLGSVISILLAIYLGLTRTLLFGGGLYLGALAVAAAWGALGSKQPAGKLPLEVAFAYTKPKSG